MTDMNGTQNQLRRPPWFVGLLVVGRMPSAVGRVKSRHD